MSISITPISSEQRWQGLPACVRPKAETCDLHAVEDAIRLLNAKATQLAFGSTSVWRIVDHARRHLEKQIERAIR